MTPYPGNTPVVVHVSGTGANGVIVTAGPTDAHGFFPTGLSIDDGDQRSAGNLANIGQAQANRTQWLAWRTIDWIAGGTYTWTGNLALSNPFTFNGGCLFMNEVVVSSTGFFVLRGSGVSYIGNSAILNVGDPAGLDGIGKVKVLSGSEIQFDAGSTLSAFTAINGAAVPLVVGGGGGVVNVDCSAGNTFWVRNALTAAQTYNFTLINANSGTRVKIYFLCPSDVSALTVGLTMASPTLINMSSGSTISGFLANNKHIALYAQVIIDSATNYLILDQVTVEH